MTFINKQSIHWQAPELLEKPPGSKIVLQIHDQWTITAADEAFSWLTGAEKHTPTNTQCHNFWTDISNNLLHYKMLIIEWSKCNETKNSDIWLNINNRRNRTKIR